MDLERKDPFPALTAFPTPSLLRAGSGLRDNPRIADLSVADLNARSQPCVPEATILGVNKEVETRKL